LKKTNACGVDSLPVWSLDSQTQVTIRFVSPQIKILRDHEKELSLLSLQLIFWPAPIFVVLLLSE